MTPKPTLTAGIVGAGFSAAFHVEALRRVYSVNIRLAGVYSPTPAHCQAFADRHDFTAYDTLDALLDAVDVVHICAPAAAHETLAIQALARGKYAIVEKPFTGYFGDGAPDFNGYAAPKAPMLHAAHASVSRLLAAEQQSSAGILYAENWVYAPAIQKEREILEKTGAQILWMHGEEAHSGSHSSAYGHWSQAGGGSMIGKGCHPLTAALYLKAVEGRARTGTPIRPQAVSARTHILTRMDGYLDRRHLRTDYADIEDFALMHVRFEDHTLADVYASEIVLGGVHNWLEVAANNHRTICQINPNTAMQTYNPQEAAFNDIYVVEKIGTKQGWACTSPDEDWFTGYYQEMDAFYRAIAFDEPLESDSRLAADTILTIYSAYLSAERQGAEVDIPKIAVSAEPRRTLDR